MSTCEGSMMNTCEGSVMSTSQTVKFKLPKMGHLISYYHQCIWGKFPTVFCKAVGNITLNFATWPSGNHCCLYSLGSSTTRLCSELCSDSAPWDVGVLPFVLPHVQLHGCLEGESTRGGSGLVGGAFTQVLY